MYKETRIIQASEIGFNNKVRIKNLIDMIQDVEGAHIESLRALSGEIKSVGFAIILNFRYVHIKKWPVYKDMLELTTYPYETKPFYGYRNTIIKDLLGNLVLESYCLGSFIHLDTKSPHRLSPYVLNTLGNKEKHEMTYIGRKIDLNKELEYLKTSTQIVQPSHLDYYKHLNNAIYIDFAYNMLPINYDFDTVAVEYKKDFQLFQKIIMKLYKTTTSYIVQFYDENDNLFTIVEFK
ncbi:acyl-ACP thioesterase domain-containing protein [Acholeplasma granularum]|uniref:acyl-ACP thioesterase domain-containing protein n=1 Tax=Acholeplasma granularum TaxID=264635 RepID=UPI00046FA3FA|nr:acyl-ACP thioesterase domain-containing protein [Acholeplasma granularum]